MRPLRVFASAVNCHTPPLLPAYYCVNVRRHPHYRATPVHDHPQETNSIKNIRGTYIDRWWKDLSVRVLSWE